MKLNETERIDKLKEELRKCREAPWNSLSLLVAIIGAFAIGYYFFNDPHYSFLIGGIIGLALGLSFWFKLRGVYKELVKAYEAELDVAKSNQKCNTDNKEMTADK
jgi:hypothetical protein